MKPPAFQFYADDFVAGTVEMTTLEIGAYILLLCYQWSKGFIPDDDNLIRRIARETQTFDLATLRTKFKSKKGKLFNVRLEQERQKQIEFRKKQSDNGQKGGRPKNPSLSQPLSKTKAKKSSPSPSPSPVLNTFGIKLSTPRISELWKKWMEHRRTFKKPKCWSTLFNEQIKFLEEFTEEQAFQVLQTSVMNGYQGLFPPKGSPANGNGANGDSFWKLSKELELVETELKKINERASQTAMNKIIQPQDLDAYNRLRNRRSEIKSKLQLK
jgi:uncharacterized protein YdaU (DUF1376 family)